MFLKRLEVVGFKSFATKTAAEMPPGIVVVVGPNGSGKSNIADALRWVLGEQSARAVRARKSEEVIFAGSATRQPLGMAEVSLLLDNADGAMPLAYQEVRISRRLYRSGESEYLLNGARVRLRDVTTNLLHAGLGPDSYCVIGQGSVDELILQRPEERRVAFESAADIRRHQVQLADTRSKLSQTEANLTRAQDVVAELAPHVRRLKGQADRARRADALRSELETLLVYYHRRRLADVREAHHAAQAALRATSAELERAQAELGVAQQAAAGAEERLAQVDERLAALRPRLEQARDTARQADRALAVAGERLTAAEQQRQLLASERGRLVDREAALRAEVAQHEAEAASLNADVAPAAGDGELDRTARRAEAQAQQASQTLSAARTARDVAERRILQAEADLAGAQELARAHERHAAAEAARVSERAARIEALSGRLQGLERQRDELRAALDPARKEQADTERARAAAAERVAEVRAAARQLAQQADRLQGALDALGNAVRPTTSALDPAWRDALAGVHVLGTALDVASRVRPLDAAVRGLLARTVVVEDDAAARDAHHRLSQLHGESAPAWAVVSLQGLFLPAPGARVLGGAGGEGSALADWGRRVQELRAERAGVAARRAEADAADAAAQAEATVAENAAAASRAVVRDLEARLLQAERGARDVRLELESLRSQAERAARQEATGRQEAERVAARLGALQAALATAREARDTAAGSLTEAEQAQAEAARVAAAARAALDRARQETLRRQATRESRMALLKRAQEELRQHLRTVMDADTRIAQIEQSAAGLQLDLSRLEQDRYSAAAAVEPCEQQVTMAERERAEANAARRQAESLLQERRAAERALRERREQASVRAQRAADDLERAEREVEEHAGGDLEDPQEAGWVQQVRLQFDELPAAEPVPAGFDVEAARKRIAALQRDLRQIGAVGDGVLEEYQELSGRHDFLARQAEDLRKAIAELRAAASELEAHMRERFSAVFGSVNAAFQECFTTLFGGGEARLVLTEPDDLLRTGIDIAARPPGKKLQGLLSLSGGERALTVVALLFGLLKVNPTPFCVLDEVDAALDEANVQRFARLLAEFARGIQFIVVTHNRATMEVADAMYGVTMDAQGVSRVYSVQPRALATSPA